MNWPQEFIIKMNNTKNKIINKEHIVEYLNRFCDTYILEKYLNNLKSQNLLNINEIKELIDVTENRINEIKKIKEDYEILKHNQETLAEFYEKNYNFFKDLIDIYIVDKYEINDIEKKYLVDFLQFCIDRENDKFENLSTQNTLNMQKTFDYCFINYKEENIKDIDLKEKLDHIKESHNNFLNKIDKDEYEKDYYVEAKGELEFVKNKNDNLTGLDKAAFVSVTVILEATLVGTLLIALISLVK